MGDEQRNKVKTLSEHDQALTGRLDDMNLRVSALKVKTDGAEGRLQTFEDRSESSRKPLEAQFQQQIDDQIQRFSRNVESRIETMQQQLNSCSEEAMIDICEEILELSLERRL